MKLEAKFVSKFVGPVQSIGIDVIIASLSLISNNEYGFEYSRKIIIVASKSNVAWEILLDDDEKIGLSTLIADATTVSNYQRILKQASKDGKNVSVRS